MHPEYVAIKIEGNCFIGDDEEFPKVPYLLISRFDPCISDLAKTHDFVLSNYDEDEDINCDLIESSFRGNSNNFKFPIIGLKHSYGHLNLDDEDITLDIGAKDGSEHWLSTTFYITAVKGLRKADLTSEELYYVFNQSVLKSTVFDDTDAFQKYYGLKSDKPEVPEFLDDEKMQMKIGHLHEELEELEKSYKEGNLSECADAIIDLIYVASGLGNLLNLPMLALWRDVQNSNMIGKERVTSIENATKRGSTFDVRKTAEWKGPRGAEIIEEHRKAILNELVDIEAKECWNCRKTREELLENILERKKWEKEHDGCPTDVIPDTEIAAEDDCEDEYNTFEDDGE